MRKFIVEIVERCVVSGFVANSYEVPVYAENLDEALEVIDQKYTSQGVETGRVYQQINEVKQ